jgi:plastocyanin
LILKRTILVLVVLAGLVLSANALASSYTVLAGEQAMPPAGVPKLTTLNAFFPSKLAIHAGDTVKFQSLSFHTVLYTGGKPAPAIIVPDPSKALYANVLGVDSQPFWFNGQPKLIYNPEAFGPIPGKEVVKGKPVGSGVLAPQGPKSPPATVTWTFPQTGTFKLLCTVHPGMTATVTVKSASATAPSPAQVASEALAGIAKQWQEAKRFSSVTAPPNTVLMGPGRTSPTLLGYQPETLRVKVGTTVTFVEYAKSEVHNVTFGPKKWIQQFQKKNDLLPQGPSAPNQVSPVMVYGSEPPGVYVYDGTTHGNGFLSTPLNDNAPGNPPQGLAGSAKVKFTKAGTYRYFCLLHGPDMKGTIVVTP